MNDHPDHDAAAPHRGSTVKLVVSYTIVGVPLLYGLVATAIKASRLFTG